VDELFYFAVVCVLAIRNAYESTVWDRKIYKVMLGANFALSVIGIYDALCVWGIKSSYLFIGYTNQEFGEVEQQISQYTGYMCCNFIVWMIVLTPFFALALVKGTDYLRRTS